MSVKIKCIKDHELGGFKENEEYECKYDLDRKIVWIRRHGTWRQFNIYKDSKIFKHFDLEELVMLALKGEF